MARLRYWPLGAAADLFRRREAELLLSGPAGTGKSRACLEKVHLVLCRHPGARGLLLRKTRASLTESAMVTLSQKVLHPLDLVTWKGYRQEYCYPNGSALVVAGLDRASKVMSSEYDLAYVQEATELAEADWEAVTTRLRNGVVPYQQLLADCNPDAPTHWLKLRCDSGRTLLLESRHRDNPVLWDPQRGEWTEAGRLYMARLDALTGVRRLRLRDGLWAAAEGLVFEGWDRALHLVDAVDPTPQPPPRRGEGVSGRIGERDRWGVPREWPRFWSVDFGFTRPFCWQAWAEDPDGRLYRYLEVYRTRRLVEDHAREIRRLTLQDPRPRAVICDHDAEDRATLERHLGIATVAAPKAVSPGLQAVASRLRPAGDGRPRLFLVRGALVERDPELVEAKLPTCTEEEVEGYVWDRSGGRKKGEEPVKEHDHGMDALRYLVAYRDLQGDRKATGRPKRVAEGLW